MQIPVSTRIAKLEADVANLQEHIKRLKQVAKSDAPDESFHRTAAFLNMGIGFALGMLAWEILRRFPPP